MSLLRRSLLLNLALLSGSVATTLLLAEAGLRLAGFEYQPFPRVQFGWPDPTSLRNLYEPDPDLLWVPRDYASLLERARESRPALIFLGDSCTEFGQYPERTLALLAQRRPDLSSGMKLGVGGWSTEQGLAQLRRDIVPLHPKVVTFYFGWNDHWIALGPPDAEIPRIRALGALARHSRLFQLLGKARMAAAGPPSSRPNRVDLPRYRSNLETMVRLSREAGILPVLITAPSHHLPGREPSYLAQRHLRRLQDLIPLHQSYVEATREAARKTGATLCDAAWAFRFLPPPAERYFQQDGIHLSDEGDREMARILAGCIESAAGASMSTEDPAPGNR